MSHGEGPAATPKKRSTLTILLVIVGAGSFLILLVLAIGTYMIMSSKEGRAIVGVMGEAIRVGQKAQKAPGTKELRAAGCKQAMVMDTDDFAKITAHLDAGAEPKSPFGEIVVCTVPPWGTAPDCDPLASTYVRAVGPRSRRFALSVQQQGKAKPVCSFLYDENGTKLEDAVGTPNIAAPPEE